MKIRVKASYAGHVQTLLLSRDLSLKSLKDILSHEFCHIHKYTRIFFISHHMRRYDETDLRIYCVKLDQSDTQLRTDEDLRDCVRYFDENGLASLRLKVVCGKQQSVVQSLCVCVCVCVCSLSLSLIQSRICLDKVDTA